MVPMDVRYCDQYGGAEDIDDDEYEVGVTGYEKRQLLKFLEENIGGYWVWDNRLDLPLKCDIEGLDQVIRRFLHDTYVLHIPGELICGHGAFDIIKSRWYDNSPERLI